SPVRLQARHFRVSLPVARLDAPSPTLGYVVLFLPSPWAFARLIAGRPSPSKSATVTHGSFAPPGLSSPRASSLLRPDPPVCRAPRISRVSLIPQALGRQTFPAF